MSRCYARIERIQTHATLNVRRLPSTQLQGKQTLPFRTHVEPSTQSTAKGGNQSTTGPKRGEQGSSEDFSSATSRTSSSRQRAQQAITKSSGTITPRGRKFPFIASAEDAVQRERDRQRLLHELLTLCLDGALTAAKLNIPPHPQPQQPEQQHSREPFRVLDIGTPSLQPLWPAALSALHASADQARLHISCIGHQQPLMVSPQQSPLLADLEQPLPVLPTNVCFDVDTKSPSSDLFAPGWSDRWHDRRRRRQGIDGNAGGKDVIDFIHVRGFVGDFSGELGISWPRFFEECFTLLKTGGAIEVAELRPRWFSYDERARKIYDDSGDKKDDSGSDDDDDDGSWSDDKLRTCFERLRLDKSICGGRLQRKFASIHRELARRAGDLHPSIDPAPQISSWLYVAGFERIVERTEMVTVGTWANDDKMKRRGALMIDLLRVGGKFD